MVCGRDAVLEGWGADPARVSVRVDLGGVRVLIGLFIAAEIGQLFGLLHYEFAFGLLEF
jgi:hypothetical protein